VFTDSGGAGPVKVDGGKISQVKTEKAGPTIRNVHLPEEELSLLAHRSGNIKHYLKRKNAGVTTNLQDKGVCT
jgi:hypothetical protein